MLAVLQGFATIGGVAFVGWLLAHLKVLDESASVSLSKLAFYVASPCLLLTVMQRTPLSVVLSANLWTAAAGAVGAMALFTLLAWRLWPGRSLGDSVIGCLCAGYVNGGNLGLPIALYVLGDVAWVAPTLLLQLLVLTPIALALLDADALGQRPTLWRSLQRMSTNPITLGALSGLLLAIFDLNLPRFVAAPVDIIGAMAVPSMLIAYGIALRLGPLPAAGESAGQVWTLVTVKLAAQPLLAWGFGAAFGLSGPALFAVVVLAALPTAQNVFTYAVRYDRSRTLTRDAIFISTFASVPVIMGISLAFHLTGSV